MFKQYNATLVVLDDDPTGTQTVYDTPVLTEWSQQTLDNEISNQSPLFYILTNSRSLPPEQAEQLALEIGAGLKQASDKFNRKIFVISRSDSTLRGHFPGEVDALAKSLGIEDAVRVIIPAFFAGGRFTIDDIHYVKEDDNLIPAAITVFAKDASFGYVSSDLKDWVEEKTEGRLKANNVVSISIKNLRGKGIGSVANKLMKCKNGTACIVNAVSQRDLEVFAVALYKVCQSGKNFLLRTAASIVPILAGMEPRPLLMREDLLHRKRSVGLIVVGSHVSKSTKQLQYLLEHADIEAIEIQVEQLLTHTRRDDETARVISSVDKLIDNKQDVLLFTSRQLVAGKNSRSSLSIAHTVSESIVRIVEGQSTTPDYVIAKGGITSSDIATKAYQLKRARVMGQILPGVPVWRFEDSAKHTGMLYVVFPGNVGGEDALYKAYKKLY
ncbi:hypothetical protein JW935_04530 [candidate division KSB1 bacterium]|nr:hypothetical protein [candidate division KSB1 bacterium]